MIAGAALVLFCVPRELPAVIGFSLTCNVKSDDCVNCPLGPGSGNGMMDPGEEIVLEWILTNVGDEEASSILALVDPLTSDMFCQPDAIDFGTLLASETSPPTDSPVCLVDLSTLCGSVLRVTLQINTAQGVFSAFCDMSVPSFCDTCCGVGFAALDSCAVDADFCPTGGAGSGDGLLDPGETVAADVFLINQGTQRTGPVRARVTSLTPGMTVLFDETQYDTILYPDTEAGVPPVRLFVDEFVPPGSSVTLHVDIEEEDPVQGWQKVNEGDCTLPVADPAIVCLPDVLPGPVPRLDVHRRGQDLELDWQEAPDATRYAIHEGPIQSPPAPPWLHTPIPSLCLVPPPTQTLLSGVASDGRNLYFLLQARNGLGESGVGIVDLDGDGSPETARPADLSSCN